METVPVTGSSGLIGSETVRYFDALGWQTVGLDNNMRAQFFGADGDTEWNRRRLASDCPRFRHVEADIRDRARMLELVAELRPDLIVHSAAQPSHDLAANVPFEDFDVNRIGDHICYYSDISRMRSHFPKWKLTRKLDAIFEDFHRAALRL